MRSLLAVRRSCRSLLRPAAAAQPVLKPLGAAHAAQQSSDGPTPSGSPALAFGLLGAGLAAAWLEQAQCESAAEHGRLTDARISVMRTWREVEHDLDRLEAALPFRFGLARTRPPDVHLRGGRLVVSVYVQEGADVSALLEDLVAALGGQPSGVGNETKTTIEVAESAAATQLDLRCAGRPGLDVIVRLPRQPRPGTAVVEFLFAPEAQLGEADLEALASAMRAANGLRVHRSGSRGSSALSRSLQTGGGLPGLLTGAHSLLGEGALALEAELLRWEQGMRGELERLMQPPELEQQGGPSPGLPENTHAAGSQQPCHDYGSPAANAAVAQLERLGAVVHPPGTGEAVDWGALAGYEAQKEAIEEALLLALRHPDVFAEVAGGTRARPGGGGGRARAVLFEGPPGCGKTTSARVLASQAGVPLVYVPIESCFTKWFGESERILADIFRAAEALPGCLIFLDEIDSLATQRSGEMHEATRRVLGVLLRQLDGFQAARSVVVGATNRRQDLDAALLSRFGASIAFQLPTAADRQLILAQFARQLGRADLEALAAACEGMSGRDLRDVCEAAERRVASQIVRQKLARGSLPGLADYMAAAAARREAGPAAAAPLLPGGLFARRLAQP